MARFSLLCDATTHRHALNEVRLKCPTPKAVDKAYEESWRFLHTSRCSQAPAGMDVPEPLLCLSFSREEVDGSNSSNIWTVTEEATGNLKQPRQENLRKKRKKRTKRLPLQELMCSDFDGSSRSTRSPEPIPGPFPEPRVGDWEAP
jgi:hypothetical protein